MSIVEVSFPYCAPDQLVLIFGDRFGGRMTFIKCTAYWRVRSTRLLYLLLLLRAFLKELLILETIALIGQCFAGRQ